MEWKEDHGTPKQKLDMQLQQNYNEYSQDHLAN